MCILLAPQMVIFSHKPSFLGTAAKYFVGISLWVNIVGYFFYTAVGNRMEAGNGPGP